MLRRPTAALIALGTLLATRASLADEWLTFRHDPQRTGASSGRVDIDRPTTVWRRYLGGSLDGSRFLAADVDRDGRTDVVYIAGGRAIAKHADNVIVWESPLLVLRSVVDVTDLDEDGTSEVLVVGNAGQAHLLSGRDGSVLWSNPADGTIAEVGSVRVADLDGDGHLDVYVQECRCCTFRGSSNGVAYSFNGGFSAARRLFALDTSIGSCVSSGDLICDVDGDGANELVSVSDAEMVVVSGRDGTRRWSAPAPSTGSFYSTQLLAANVDGDPAAEIFAVTNAYQAIGERGARRLAVFDFTATADPPLAMRWEAASPDRANDAVYTVAGGVADFNGDGSIEVAFGINAGPVPRVEVRDAATGALRATLASSSLAGAADLDNDGRAELIVNAPAGLTAQALDATGNLVQRWALPARSMAGAFDHAGWAAGRLPGVPLTLDLDADPARELIVSGSDAMGRATLWAVNADGATTSELGSFSADGGLTLLATGAGRGLTQDQDQVMAVTSDGYLVVLDRTMRPTNRVTEGDVTLPGMRVGGYYSGPGGLGPTPYIAAFGASRGVIVRDSRPALLRLDASAASLATPPADVWASVGANWPAFLDADGDGARDVAVIAGLDVVALDAATARTEHWRAAGAVRGLGSGMDLVATRRGATDTDLGFMSVLPGAVVEAGSLDGRTGTSRWATRYARALQWGYLGHAYGDLDGDGIDDMIPAANSVFSISGATGAVTNDNADFVAYGLPMVLDGNGDGASDVWMHGGYFADRLLSGAMGTIATRTDHTTPHTQAWGARVACAGDAAVVSGAAASAHLWSVRTRDASPLAHRVLVDGESYAPDAAPPGRRQGFLGNVTAVAASRTGGGPAVLVGSTDGYLYALDPCTLDKLWSLNLRYPVGEPVVGDTNGDGTDELLVTCADGFLYGVGRAAFDAPMQVIDTDPEGGRPADDVDEIDTVDTLYATWSAVPGATRYEVGVFSEGGSEARFPNFRDVGNATSVRLDALPLRLGQRYRVAVRPVGPAGPGLEGQSDGVVVTDNAGAAAAVQVMPARAWPAGGVTPTVVASCRDRVALASYRLEVLRADGGVARVLEARDITSPSRDLRLPWDGLDGAGASSPAGDYRARIVCVDRRMHETTAEAAFALDPAARPEPDAGPTADAGAGVDADAGPGGGGGGGCGCRTASPSRRSPYLTLIAVAGLAASRRRRARSQPR